MPISKCLFYLLIFFLPLNLGRHFILRDSFVSGLLVDYLIPTIYIQDGLILLILGASLFEKRKGFSVEKLKEFLNRREIQLGLLFMFSVFLSVLSGVRPPPSFFAFLRLLLYFLFFIYVVLNLEFKEVFPRIISIMSFGVIFLGFLAVLQFARQGSVFDNYLVLGEQPYSISTPQVTRERFLGFYKIPAYGLFRHPNIFGGFLAVVLVWVLSRIKDGKLYVVSFILGFIGLVLTLSLSSWIVFLLGALSLYYKKILISLPWLVICVFVFSLFLLDFSGLQNRSLGRRARFLDAAFGIIKERPLFGVGYNNVTVVMENYLKYVNEVRFLQPVHNIFVLVFSESGVFAFLFFVSLFYFSLIKSLPRKLVFISLVQMAILGCFDHYFVTIHQTQILFWLALGLSFCL